MPKHGRNTIKMIFEFLNYLFFAVLHIGVLLLSIGVHEMAHFVYARDVLNKDIQFTFSKKAIYLGREKDFKGISKRQAIGLYSIGFIAGSAIILLMSIEYPSMIFLLIPHAIGSKSDFQNLSRLIRE